MNKLNSSNLFNIGFKSSLTLGIFAIVTVFLIAITYVMTKAKIANQIRQFEIKALSEIISQNLYDNSLIDTKINIAPDNILNTKTEKTAYIAFKQNKPVAIILPVHAPDGYSGNIELIVSIHENGQILGVRAINQHETPGLGDKINIKISHWIDSFIGKSLNNTNEKQWNVKKDGGIFDQFTGATITPRATTNAIYRCLKYFQIHKKELFNLGKKTLNQKNHMNIN